VVRAEPVVVQHFSLNSVKVRGSNGASTLSTNGSQLAQLLVNVKCLDPIFPFVKDIFRFIVAAILSPIFKKYPSLARRFPRLYGWIFVERL
jgi:hypothetical protein